VIEVATTPRRAMSPMRRLKIWEEHKGICILCGLKIDGVREPWIIEHKRALVLGGTDTDDNCGPAHETCRRTKDKADVADGARAKRRKAKMLGIRKASTFPKPPPGFKFSWKTGRLEKETA
jgi:5-methylcytosine-specific restriction endonuclease McrA